MFEKPNLVILPVIQAKLHVTKHLVYELMKFYIGMLILDAVIISGIRHNNKNI